MTCPNKFPKYYSRYRVFQIYDLRLKQKINYIFLFVKQELCPLGEPNLGNI